jgi:hypothetical protein
MRFSQHGQQGMALGHGPPPHFPGPPTPSYWQVPQPPLGTPVGLAHAVPSPTFILPNPIDVCGGSRPEHNLLPPFDGLMSRTTSHSSMVSSPSESCYTPMSSQESNDYFAHGRELRSVSASSHYRHDAGWGFSAQPLAGTISLSRIQEGRVPVKHEPAPSVTDSEAGTPAPSIHPSVHSSPSVPVKAEYHSPHYAQLSSPVGSVGSIHESPTYSGQFHATDARDIPYATPGKFEPKTARYLLTTRALHVWDHTEPTLAA